jgi:UDP-GlcNAc:undecaprenyl-phosphate GlcNAc-1-phosphate transferase
MPLVLVAVFTLALALVSVDLARRLALRIGFVAIPQQDRWHRKPTPLLGGSAIYVSFVLAFMVFTPDLYNAYPILAAGTLLFLTGMIDDAIHIKPPAKLVMQFIAAATLVYFGAHLPWVNYLWINDVLTIFWLVGMTNAINLLDNMDGLAGGVSLIACVFLAVTFLLNGQTAEAFLPVMLGAAVLGFLFYNFNPASIFMGDSGSMFLGFVLSGLALLAGTARFRSLTSVLLTPVLILVIPIFDTCLVIVMRKLSGRPISRGGRDHTSHRLVALGMTERRAVLMCYSFAAISGGLALSLRWLESSVTFPLVSAFALGVVVLGIRLSEVRVYQDEEKAAGTPLFRAIGDFAYKRRIFEATLDVLLVTLAYYGAYLLRWDGSLPDQQLAIFVKTLPVIIIVNMCLLFCGGVYRGLWKYVGIDDLVIILRAAFSGALVGALLVFLMYRSTGPSRGVFLLDLLLLPVLIAGSRLSFRLIRTAVGARARIGPEARPVLIYGAGDRGEHLVRELLDHHGDQYSPVGFIDDNQRKLGRLIHGCRIFGSDQLPRLIEAYNVEEVIVSSTEVASPHLDRLRGLGLSLKTLNVTIDAVQWTAPATRPFPATKPFPATTPFPGTKPFAATKPFQDAGGFPNSMTVPADPGPGNTMEEL